MSQNHEPPQPDPALRRLDRLVGRWSMEGRLVGPEESTVRGETSFRWLPGGFLQAGQRELERASRPAGETGPLHEWVSVE
jgi:hypothetical protein